VTTPKRSKRGVVAQCRAAFARGNRLAAAVGLAIGGFVPVATYLVAHAVRWELSPVVVLAAVLALGGLAFSAPTVFDWTREAFGGRGSRLAVVKAGGFVVLLEGVMVCARGLGLEILGLVALAYLVLVNAAATAARIGDPLPETESKR
jgi:hypothetical protein